MSVKLPIRNYWGNPKGEALRLTPHQAEALTLAAQGLSDETIAERLVLDVRSINSLLYRVYRKLCPEPGRNRSLAICRARKAGLIHLTFPPEFPSHKPLTLREVEVLTMTRDGLGAREIGKRLVLSNGTVTFHLENARRKLVPEGTKSKYLATYRAEGLGLIPPLVRS